MSDDNIIDFSKIKEENTDFGDDIEARIMSCIYKGESCQCKYCSYKKGAAEMVLEFLAKDMAMYTKRLGGEFVTYDAKDILFRSIRLVKEMEKEKFGDPEKKD